MARPRRRRPCCSDAPRSSACATSIYLDESAEGGASSSSGNASSSSGGTTVDGTDGGNQCRADLQTDAKNCGRCGRDRGGAACTAGMCEPITLAANLGNPSGIAVSSDEVYVTPFTDSKLIELAKAPSVAPRDLVVESNDLSGVAVDGATLSYAVDDYT